MVSKQNWHANLLTFAICSFFAFLNPTHSARSTDLVFPPGSHFGLVPPKNFVKSLDFMGFAWPETGGSILFNELPRKAFGQLQSSDLAAGFAKQGITVLNREAVKVGGLSGISLSGFQIANGLRFSKCIVIVDGEKVTGLISLQIPEDNVGLLGNIPCASLSTIAERQKVNDRLPLPFELTDLGGLTKTKNQIKGAIVLTADKNGTSKAGKHPLMIIAPSLGAVAAADRSIASRQALQGFRGLRNGKIVSEVRLNIDGAPGYEIVASGTYPKSAAPILVVQWMRFSKDRYIRLIGIAPSGQKEAAFKSFRQVRDGLRAR